MRLNASRVLRFLIAAIAVIVVVGYAYGRLRDLIEGPAITIVTPANGSMVTEPLAIIQGTVLRAQNITLDGRTIFISTSGQIAEPVVLAPGYNALELAATDRFGRTKTLTLALVYKSQNLVTETGGKTIELATSTLSTSSLQGPEGPSGPRTAGQAATTTDGEASSTATATTSYTSASTSITN